MGTYGAESTWQGDDIKPPRAGQWVALAVDATSRSYDLRLLSINGDQWSGKLQENVYLTLQNDSTTTNIYFTTSNQAATVDPTSVLGAGSTLAFGAAQCPFIPPNGTAMVRIRRDQDLFLNLRTASGTSTIRFGASSENTPRYQ